MLNGIIFITYIYLITKHRQTKCFMKKFGKKEKTGIKLLIFQGVLMFKIIKLLLKIDPFHNTYIFI